MSKYTKRVNKLIHPYGFHIAQCDDEYVECLIGKYYAIAGGKHSSKYETLDQVITHELMFRTFNKLPDDIRKELAVIFMEVMTGLKRVESETGYTFSNGTNNLKVDTNGGVLYEDIKYMNAVAIPCTWLRDLKYFCGVVTDWEGML